MVQVSQHTVEVPQLFVDMAVCPTVALVEKFVVSR